MLPLRLAIGRVVVQKQPSDVISLVDGIEGGHGHAVDAVLPSRTIVRITAQEGLVDAQVGVFAALTPPTEIVIIVPERIVATLSKTSPSPREHHVRGMAVVFVVVCVHAVFIEVDWPFFLPHNHTRTKYMSVSIDG